MRVLTNIAWNYSYWYVSFKIVREVQSNETKKLYDDKDAKKET